MVVFADLCKKIQQEIADGVFQETLPTLRELSLRYGVGVSTVKISLKRLKELGYLDGRPGKCIRVNPKAAGNRFFRKNVIFYIHLHTLGLPLYSSVIERLRQEFEEVSANVHVINSIAQLEQCEFQADVLILSEVFSEEELGRVRACCPRERTIMLNQKNPQYCCIGTDNEAAGLLAIEYLYRELGHKHIGMIGWQMEYSYGVSRRRYDGAQGYAAAHREIKLQVAEAKTPEESFQALEELLRRDDQISAVFISMDVMALGVYGFCRERQLEIPKDLTVLGFDDQRFSSCLYPALSTYREDADRITALLFAKTKAMMDGESTVESLFVPPILVIRNSSATK